MDKATLLKIAPKAHPQFVNGFLQHWPFYCNKYNLTTEVAQAGLIAQMCHETQGFTKFEESGYYTAARLMKIWPKRFPTMEIARQFEKNPQKLFNHAYANRMGNGSPESGDGWNYRGGGGLQHTGRNEYLRLHGEFQIMPMDIRTSIKADSILAAAFSYCEYRKVFANLRSGDVEGATKKINGGVIGLDDRIILYRRAREALAGVKPSSHKTTVERKEAAQRQAATAGGGVAVTGTATASQVPQQKQPETANSAIFIGAIVLFVVLIGVMAWRVAAAQKEQDKLDKELGAKI